MDLGVIQGTRSKRHKIIEKHSEDSDKFTVGFGAASRRLVPAIRPAEVSETSVRSFSGFLDSTEPNGKDSLFLRRDLFTRLTFYTIKKKKKVSQRNNGADRIPD